MTDSCILLVQPTSISFRDLHHVLARSDLSKVDYNPPLVIPDFANRTNRVFSNRHTSSGHIHCVSQPTEDDDVCFSAQLAYYSGKRVVKWKGGLSSSGCFRSFFWWQGHSAEHEPFPTSSAPPLFNTDAPSTALRILLWSFPISFSAVLLFSTKLMHSRPEFLREQTVLSATLEENVELFC